MYLGSIDQTHAQKEYTCEQCDNCISEGELHLSIASTFRKDSKVVGYSLRRIHWTCLESYVRARLKVKQPRRGLRGTNPEVALQRSNLMHYLLDDKEKLLGALHSNNSQTEIAALDRLASRLEALGSGEYGPPPKFSFEDKRIGDQLITKLASRYIFRADIDATGGDPNKAAALLRKMIGEYRCS